MEMDPPNPSSVTAAASALPRGYAQGKRVRSEPQSSQTELEGRKAKSARNNLITAKGSGDEDDRSSDVMIVDGNGERVGGGDMCERDDAPGLTPNTRLLDERNRLEKEIGGEAGTGSPELQNDKVREEIDEEEADPSWHPPRLERTIYDPDGDVLIIHHTKNQERQRRLRVSSKLLGFASSVWRDLISSALAIATGSDEGETTAISLTEPYSSVSIFLKIAHLRFSELPESISFRQLYALALFSGKYGVREILLPFVGAWIKELLKGGFYHEQVQWVVIAWEFGLNDMFTAWVKHLCLEAQADGGGNVSYRGSDVSELFPEACQAKCAEYIKNRRLTHLSSLLNICQWVLSQDYCECREGKRRKQCNMMKNGYLMEGLTQLLGRWESSLDDRAASIKMSVRDLTKGLISMEFEQLPGGGEDDGPEDHSGCGVFKLKYFVTQDFLEQEEVNIRIPLERLGLVRYNADAGVLPRWKRMGFWRKDFGDEEDAETEGDGEYSPSMEGDRLEPKEEYDSEDFEEVRSEVEEENDEENKTKAEERRKSLRKRIVRRTGRASRR